MDIVIGILAFIQCVHCFFIIRACQYFQGFIDAEIKVTSALATNCDILKKELESLREKVNERKD